MAERAPGLMGADGDVTRRSSVHWMPGAVALRGALRE